MTAASKFHVSHVVYSKKKLYYIMMRIAGRNDVNTQQAEPTILKCATGTNLVNK